MYVGIYDGRGSSQTVESSLEMVGQGGVEGVYVHTLGLLYQQGRGISGYDRVVGHKAGLPQTSLLECIEPWGVTMTTAMV